MITTIQFKSHVISQHINCISKILYILNFVSCPIRKKYVQLFIKHVIGLNQNMLSILRKSNVKTIEAGLTRKYFSWLVLISGPWTCLSTWSKQKSIPCNILARITLLIIQFNFIIGQFTSVEEVVNEYLMKVSSYHISRYK